jgi:hypothetical protein
MNAAGCASTRQAFATEEVIMDTPTPVGSSLELGHDQFYGLHATQGTRTFITIIIPLLDVPDYIHRPDPVVPTPGNRRVSLEHARGFTDYLKANTDWVAPPLILRADQPVDWEPLSNGLARIKLGKARLNRKIRRLGILDGQHRVLGIDLWCDEVTNIDMGGLRQRLEEAKEDGDVIERARIERQLKDAETWTERLLTEAIAATIVMESDEGKYRQAFFDIADNALGMQRAVKVMFDSRKMLNRAVGKAIELPLLKGRVDLEVDRVLGPNPNWLSAKSVVDIIRHLHTDGITGRITAKREHELTEQGVIDNLVGFLEVIAAAFPVLADLRDGKVKPQVLRANSLLGSPVFIRVLASAYHELVKAHGWTPAQVQAYFAILATHVGTPITRDSIWAQGAPDCFLVGSNAPQPRNQQMRAEVALVVGWGTNPETRPTALKEATVTAA